MRFELNFISKSVFGFFNTIRIAPLIGESNWEFEITDYKFTLYLIHEGFKAGGRRLQGQGNFISSYQITVTYVKAFY